MIRRLPAILAIAVLASAFVADAFARGGRGSGHSGVSRGAHSGGVRLGTPHFGGRFVHRPVFFGSALFLSPSLFYPPPPPLGYYPTPYYPYPPGLPNPYDSYYIERSDFSQPQYPPVTDPNALPVASNQYYCPEARQYYPQVIDCKTGWLTMPPDGEPPR